MLKLKNVKLFIVLLIVFVLFLGITSCYAVDLDLSTELENGLLSNVTNSNTNNSSSSNTNKNNTLTDNSTNGGYTNTNSSSTNLTPSATITNSMPESDLGLTNILNIFLIVIGVLLILLAIAILIKLKR